MEFEREVLRKKIGDLPGIKNRLDALKVEREREILNSANIVLKAEYEKLTGAMDVLVMKQKEIEEAMEAGEKAEKLLTVIIAHLEKATNWGNWDVLSDNRGGDIMKHQSIDKAMEMLPRAQHHLKIFQRELQDLGKEDVRFSIHKLELNKFTDFFFDNLISDWIIQQKIKSSLGKIQGTLRGVSEVLENLKNEKGANLEKYKELEQKKESILLS